MLDVGTFTTDIATTSYQLAKIGIASVSCERCTIRGCTRISDGRIGVGIVAKSCILIKFEHENTTRPRTIGKPKFTFFIEENAWINTIRPQIAPGIGLITRRERRLCTQNHLQIGILIVHTLARACLPIETTKDNRGLVNERSSRAIAGQQNHNRSPIVTIDTEVQTPFPHVGIINDVRSPLTTGHPSCLGHGSCPFTDRDARIGGSKRRSIITAKGHTFRFRLTWKTTLHDMNRILFECLIGIFRLIPSLIIASDVAISLKILGLDTIIMRTIDIECLCGCIPHNRRVMDTFPIA